ncbi:MAG: starch-binding protein [Muribaculaceae bacterium]|nr:starch-binding protein [Muribaculaceae bacterium]
MKKIYALMFLALLPTLALKGQGWPSEYGGVVLQGFFWDSFRPVNDQSNQTMATMYGAGWGVNDEWYVPVTNWVELLNQKDNIAPYIDLLWLPQSGATVCSDKSVFTTEGEAWRAGHNGSWVCTRWGDTINNPDCMGFVPVFYLDHNRGETYNVNGTTWAPKSYFGTESELINLISAYKAAGTGAMEDVVANHKGGLSTWSGNEFAADFVDEIDVIGPTTGKTYSIQWDWDENGKCVDLCCDDESGMGSGNYDCGGDAGKGPWARDIDHHNPATQQKVLTYLRYLKDELGYVGFRYDYARGFEPKHFAYYNTQVRPTFSVGEFWGTTGDIMSWIKGVYDEGGFQSAAFDFPLQEMIRQAFNDLSGHSFRLLKNDGLMWNYRFKRYAVTFIDNHDTFKDLPTDASNSNYQHRVNNQIVEANCFILAMPGTPCLFYPHFMNPAWHDIIARFVKARRTAGVTNESTVWDPEMIGSYSIAWRVTGEKGELYLQLGDESVGMGVPSGFSQVWCNDQGTCRLSITSSLADQVDSNVKQDLVYGYPVISKSSGNYSAPVEVNVKPSTEGTVLVYTTDGKTPGAYSAQITDTAGMNLSFDRTTTLKVGVLANGQVRANSIVTRDYVVDNGADDGRIRIYVKYDGGSLPYLFAFNDQGNALTDPFPGWPLSETNSVIVGGVRWVHATLEASKINIILSYGSNATQTADINGITSDAFFSFSDGVAYDLTSTYLPALYNPTVSVDMASGDYTGEITARLTASNSDAVIVYTTDGSEPSATNGIQVTYQGSVTFSTAGKHVLRAGVLRDGIVINQVARTYFINENNTVSIYVAADNDPYIYAWEVISGENVVPVGWPGTKLTEKNAEGWYHYSQVAPSLNIIFNNGYGGQTGNIEGLTPGDHYFTYDGYSGYTRVDAPESVTLPSCAISLGDDVFYCYFENSAHYANPYTWITDQTVIYTGSCWPGEALVSPVGVANNGNQVYRWVYEGDLTTMPANVIFSDNGNQATQTQDFEFVNGGYYNANGLVGVVKSNVMSLADIVNKGEVGKEYVVANDLTGVWLNGQDQWLWVKDENGDAVNPSYNSQSLPLPEAAAGMDFDQSNWAQLILKDPVAADDGIEGSLLLGQTLIGVLTDRVNPTIELRSNPVPAATASYTPNTFLPANFVEQTEYFMVEPKPQEYVNIKWAVCREQLNDTTFIFAVPESDSENNSENLSGAFKATVKQGYWEEMSSYDPESTIRVNYLYDGLTGIVRAIDAGQQMLAGFSPDDAEHSPVSDKWELYLISATEPVAPVLIGDVNNDGKLSIADVTGLINYLLSDPSLAPVQADVNGDGKINIADVTALINILLSNN